MHVAQSAQPEVGARLGRRGAYFADPDGNVVAVGKRLD
jgi:hypothetical protein